MPMYVILGHFTDQGARNVKELLPAFQKNRANGEKLGIKLHGWYLTQGRYDFVVLVEAPSAEVMLQQTLTVAGNGMTRSETLRAYPIDEAQQLLQG
ncbi:MAG TPA: GYD domain-containing protein [Thermomicrobiaceae bacterium]|nr:GYD domain-containing protein [Thermomicrobiaceae bacterium]